jgi:hypothetical protein
MKRTLTAATLAATLALPLAAMAQSTQPLPASPPPSGPNASRVPPEKLAKPGDTTSSRLSRSNGTITPPNVDPGMETRPPAMGGTMPVLKPPGATGKVQPK